MSSCFHTIRWTERELPGRTEHTAIVGECVLKVVVSWDELEDQAVAKASVRAFGQDEVVVAERLLRDDALDALQAGCQAAYQYATPTQE